MLPTPKNRDWKGGLGTSEERQTHDLDKVILGQKAGLKLQPAFVEWMMGYPDKWTELID